MNAVPFSIHEVDFTDANDCAKFKEVYVDLSYVVIQTESEINPLYYSTITQYDPVDNDSLLSEYENLIKNEDANIFLFFVMIESEKKPIGMVVCSRGKTGTPEQEYYYIYNFAICPKYQNTGIGKQFLERVMNIISERDETMSFFSLYVTEGNNHAERVYKTLQFESVSKYMICKKLHKK